MNWRCKIVLWWLLDWHEKLVGTFLTRFDCGFKPSNCWDCAAAPCRDKDGAEDNSNNCSFTTYNSNLRKNIPRKSLTLYTHNVVVRFMCCAPRYLIIITPVGAGAWQEHWSTVPGLCRLSRDILEVYVVANINWSVLVLMLDAGVEQWSGFSKIDITQYCKNVAGH